MFIPTQPSACHCRLDDFPCLNSVQFGFHYTEHYYYYSCDGVWDDAMQCTQQNTMSLTLLAPRSRSNLSACVVCWKSLSFCRQILPSPLESHAFGRSIQTERSDGKKEIAPERKKSDRSILYTTTTGMAAATFKTFHEFCVDFESEWLSAGCTYTHIVDLIEMEFEF